MDIPPLLLAQQTRTLIRQSKLIIARRTAYLATTRDQMALSRTQMDATNGAFAALDTAGRDADNNRNGGGWL